MAWCLVGAWAGAGRYDAACGSAYEHLCICKLMAVLRGAACRAAAWACFPAAAGAAGQGIAQHVGVCSAHAGQDKAGKGTVHILYSRVALGSILHHCSYFSTSTVRVRSCSHQQGLVSTISTGGLCYTGTCHILACCRLLRAQSLLLLGCWLAGWHKRMAAGIEGLSIAHFAGLICTAQRQHG